MLNNYPNQGTKSAEHIDLIASIRYAKQIQDALLIDRVELGRIFNHFSIVYRPKNIVSGDFYYAKQVGNRKYIVVGDCTGHGVPGAFMSILCNDYIIRALQNEMYPHKILSKVCKELRDRFNTDKKNGVRDGMDVSIAMIDYDEMNIYFAGANQDGVLLDNTNKNRKRLKADRRSIGRDLDFDCKTPFTFSVTSFNSEDTLYLFTDGYKDQFNEEDRKLGKRSFYNLLSNISLTPIKQQEKRLNDFYDSFKGNTDQIDDVLVLGVQL